MSDLVQKKIILAHTSGPTQQFRTVLFSNDSTKRVPAGEGIMFICSEETWQKLGSPEDIIVTVEPSP